ncbi:cadherin EGF LAG seven-pass G-type receptor 2-like isoform X2 [Babylonia areolata]|uniref:cadherin EGF LAG seven-pass G-type receptor 2-like isoform X2 n=1 Tax=Babylonia areolata TaxID=304850 RepID=UPI003FCFC653
MHWCVVTILLTAVLVNYRASAAVPSYTNSTFVVTLYEREHTQKTLANFHCTDTDPGDTPVVSLTSVTPGSPCGSCFVVYPASQCAAPGVNFCLKFIPGVGTLNYQAASQYDIIVTCTDGINDVNATVDVRLTLNTPPHFDPNQFVASYTLPNTKTVTAGTMIYDVDAIDDQNDNIVFSMTSLPTSAFFEIGRGDGVIRAKHDLSGQCMQAITFYVNITDGHNDPVGPLAVHVTLDGSNVAPDITNLDLGVQVPEDTAAGDVIVTMAATDDNAVTGLTYTLSASPSANLAFFEVDQTSREIKVKAALNYESSTQRNTNLTIRATDAEGCTSSLHYLYVTVTDVNEPPDLRPGYAVYSVYEGPDFGPSPSLSIPWSVVDEDNIESHTYSIIDGNSPNLFSIDSNSGELSVTTDYDIDNSNMATTQTLTVQVTDKGGLTDNATVALQFKDRNDHVPMVSTSVSTSTVCDTDTPGATLQTLVCTDDDSNFQGNNDVYFTGSATGITVLATGEIVNSVVPSAGQTYTTTAYCHDNGVYPGPLTSSPVRISVTGKVCPTTTPAPTPAPTTAAPVPTTAAPTTTTAAPATTTISNDNAVDWADANLAWIMVAALLGTALLGLLAYMCYIYCWRWCLDSCCRPPPKPRRLKATPRKVAPKEEPSPPSPVVMVAPASHLNDHFWKERYPDDDYGKQPNRQANPRPVTPVTDTRGAAFEESFKGKREKPFCAIL